MNMNELAIKVVKNEGQKKQISIGQAKEVLKIAALIVASDKKTAKAFRAYGSRLVKMQAAGKLWK